MSSNYTNAGDLASIEVTIPVNGSAVNLSSLISASLPEGYATQNIINTNVRADTAAGAARSAFLFGGAADACNSFVAAGTAEEITCDNPSNIYVEATDASTVTATLDCWLDN